MRGRRERKWHFLKDNKVNQKKLNWVFFDTETQVVTEDERVQKQNLKLGYAVHIRFDHKNKKQKEIFFTTPEEFGLFLERSVRDKGVLYVAAMQVAFDFGVSGIGKYLDNNGWEIKKPIVSESCVILYYRKDKKTIVFMDIWNYVKTSVKALGNTLDLPKLDIDFEKCTDEELREYCKRDTEIIAYFIEQYIKFIEDHDLGNMGITTPHQSFNAYKHRFRKKPLLIHNHKETLELERESYYGGRTECFRIGKIDEEIYVLDINSMYPYIMKENLFPSNFKLYSYKGRNLSSLKILLSSYLVIARVLIETDEAVYPYRRNGKLIFPAGRFWTTLCTGSLRYALEKGHIIDVDVEQGNKVYRNFAKLIMNSLYGKFGQKVKNIEPVGYDPDIEMGIRYIKDYDTGKRWSEIVINHKIFAEASKEDEAYDSFPAISAHVTDYARLHLWKLIKKAGKENVFYSDTDSLFVNRKGYERLQDEIDPYKLGKLKLEHVWDWIKIYGCKDYEYPGGVKRKGIKKNATQISDDEFEQIHFPTMRRVIMENQSGYIVLNKVRKKLKREYDKGIVKPDGKVEPIEIWE